ncbi:5-oxoprolinase subunit B family protein [Aestuariibius insulae]|uniref:5-oxoprolinase subunit B family protein n=1 Tax=Aestuariibius insulae TaxID=2058287 RepID=UPI00345E3B0B
MTPATDFPRIAPLGLEGVLVSFADRLDLKANSAAIAFRSALEADRPDGVTETSVSLASVLVCCDATVTDPDDLLEALRARVKAVDWYAEGLPKTRKLWHIPAAFDPELSPQLPEMAALLDMSVSDLTTEILAAPLRVLTIGFAPGQPYLGALPGHLNLPRQTDLTPKVPAGALVCAVRQITLFTAPGPTGWRHIGQTAFRPFQPKAERPFPLSAGDEVRWRSVSAYEIKSLRDDPMGGATHEPAP